MGEKAEIVPGESDPESVELEIKGDGSGLNTSKNISNAMDDPYDLVLAMFGLAVAAVG